MSEKFKKRNVMLCELPEILTVGQFFDLEDFSKKTGIKRIESCRVRLRILVKNKNLSEKIVKGKSLFVMRKHHVKAMTEKSKMNCRAKGSGRLESFGDDVRVESKQEAECLAHKEQCERFLGKKWNYLNL